MKTWQAWLVGVGAGTALVGCGGGKITSSVDEGAGGSGEPASCTSGEKDGDETDVDCGGACSPCEDGKACGEAEDCESGVCGSGTCAVPECGDGVTNGDEACDSSGKDTKDCNKDCTAATCGDGHINKAAGEICDAGPDREPWNRCNQKCSYGVLLDGTWDESEFAWAELPYDDTASQSDYFPALQSFHYSGQAYIYDLGANIRYEIGAGVWSLLPNPLPYGAGTADWADGAVDAASIWVPRDGKMHRFLIEDETWEVAAEEIPDGTDALTAAVFDGEGYVWYHGPDDDLVRYDTASDSYETYIHDGDLAGLDVYETRMAYDPLSNKIVFAGYNQPSPFVIFDIEEETFTQVETPFPGSYPQDNTCQDRAGGVYVGDANQQDMMYRYDIQKDEFKALPPLPAPHEYYSTCVVSEDGYLYAGMNVGSSLKRWFRIKLGKR